jgi:soluble lytic murein transglycosylase-like protein
MNRSLCRSLFCALAAALAAVSAALAASDAPHPELDALIARYARMHGIPERLVHRVVVRESRYNPTAFHRRYYGLMQISYPTAKSMGYKGPPSGLLDAEVNLTYAVPYLANAYKAAGGDETRAVALYAGGYYFVAKRKKLLGDLRDAASHSLEPKPPETRTVAEQPAEEPAAEPAALTAVWPRRDP